MLVPPTTVAQTAHPVQYQACSGSCSRAGDLAGRRNPGGFQKEMHTHSTRRRPRRSSTTLAASGSLVLAGLATAMLGANAAPVIERQQSTHEERRFEFTYAATATDIPAGAERIEIWIPVPSDNEQQMIGELDVQLTPGLRHRFTTEHAYGNKVLYVESTDGASLPNAVTVQLTADVTRCEASRMTNPGRIDPSELLGGDALAPITNEVRVRSREATARKTGDVAKARGIYDRVLADVAYDKSGQGWGQGNMEYVCDIGKGNCSDFHTLFIGMSRAADIPAYFEIGFPLPEGKSQGIIGGYHCWAWYQGDEGIWHPIDASEADKDPSRTEYFFGTVCCNRVAFSRGRDIELSPAPASGPVNFFIYPLVEVDGKSHAKVTKQFSFRDIE